ncbi:hypothetical protein [Noviherbaspirillum sp. Root189]|uniref:hypothetical protein n=1 Tax=Noviherbaspirillum sp. Root189 TaxID=1736487 RepID=UPI00070FC14B|nr:hypothetical protein [Noviherbaspirillum sp. Root189]KRB73477.1 hypothetical protein ASE07_06390 [Noviherbaspirillum sp. Root189]
MNDQLKWALRQIAQLDANKDSIGTAIFMANEALSAALPAVPAQPVECDNCGGNGGFTLDTWTDPVSGPESHSEKCDVCNGSGKEPVPWVEAQRICDLPAVDEAIRGFIEDQTGDNATCMVREILSASQAVQPPTQYDKYKEHTLFEAWWSAKQASEPLHTLVVQNAAHAAWQKRASMAAPNQGEFERRWRAVSVSLTGRADSDKAEVMRCLDGVLEAYMDKVCADHIAQSAGGQRD